jgi:hypothetical protein
MLASIGRVIAEVATRDVPEALGVGSAQAAPFPYPLPANVKGACTIKNPAQINFFALFDGLGEPWKGCVETRPAPYDVTDESPKVAIPNTLFVPYFWVDDGDPIPADLGKSGWPSKTAKLYNNFVADSPPAGSTVAASYDGRTYSVYKYDLATTKAAKTIKAAPSVTMGPNQACPTPILPLTSKRSDVINALNGMDYWEGGGTNSGEGVMWGWRVLSPTEPFTQGGPYAERTKIMVLFGDGQNDAFKNDSPSLLSEMGSYNFQRAWISYATGTNPPSALRLAISSKATYNAYLDDRQRKACANAKAAGVAIYTVLFREDNAGAKALYKECASDATKAYTAANAAQLKTAFGDIADDIAKLRLTK